MPVEGLPLRIKVTPRGTKSFQIKFHIYPPATDAHGNAIKPKPRPTQVLYVIGNSPSTSLETAKEKAQALIKAGKNGIDQRLVWEHEEAEFKRQMQTIQMDYGSAADPDNPDFLRSAWFSYTDTKFSVQKRTLQSLKRLWKHISENLGETVRTAELKPSDIGRIKAKLADRPQEFNKFRATLFSVLETEVQDGRIHQNILRKRIDGVRPFPYKLRDTVLTPRGTQDFKVFFGNLDNFPPNRRNHARFLLVLLFTGLRPSMLRSLRKIDDGRGNFVDLQSGQMFFREHKTAHKSTSKAATILASPKALEIMKQAANATASPFVFGSHDARAGYWDLAVSEKACQLLFREHAHKFETIGVDKFEIYSLRHTFGATMVNAGVPLHQVKDQMLHKSIVTTQRYVRATDETRRALASRIDTII